MKKDDLGSAFIDPGGSFPAGATGTWTVTCTVGKYGIDDGGSIIVTRRAMSDAIMPQCDDPAAPGYVTASTDGDARLRLWYDNRYFIRPYQGAIVAKVFDGSLREGDIVRIVIGDTSQGSPGWSLQTFPEKRHTFWVRVDAFGTREYYDIDNQPYLTIVPGAPASVEAILPTTARPDDELPVWVRVTDEWGNPTPDFQGRVRLTCDKSARISCAGEMKTGIERVGTVVFPDEGTFRIAVAAGEMSGRSNPVVVSQSAPRILWGDMHGQTEQTVGTGTVEDYFRFARDYALMDVAGWQGNDFQVTDETWDEVLRQSKAFNRPGEFVVFPGYEWSGLTPAGGDHNILYLDDDQPIYRSSHWQIHDGSSEENDRYPISELWREFRGRSDMMAIAHVGGRYANFDFWDEDFSGLVEIHSHHGTFEWFAEEAIERGFVAGFVGQSDDHTGRPGLSGPLRPLARDFATFDVSGGYTGIFAEERTREAVWDALKRRHCYATTGTRIFLDVRCGDSMMGDVVTPGRKRHFDITVAATAPILDLEVRRNTDTVYRHTFDVEADDSWIRVEWSGVRIRSRAKTADWDGTIVVTNGTITNFRPYAFDRRDQGVFRTSDRSLDVRSATSGDIDGVFLKVDGDAPTITFSSRQATCSVPVEELDGVRAIPAGGENLEVRFSRTRIGNRPRNLQLEFSDDDHTGRAAYWVKVVQLDGHMAWSSPIYFL